MNDRQDDLTGIQEVSRMLGVSARTLRFYEDKGLIEPCRIGTTRVYTRREVARMQLILRGKRLGFTLRDIEEFLDLYDADPQHVEQMRALAERCRQRIDLLDAQLADLPGPGGSGRPMRRRLPWLPAECR